MTTGERRGVSLNVYKTCEGTGIASPIARSDLLLRIREVDKFASLRNESVNSGSTIPREKTEYRLRDGAFEKGVVTPWSLSPHTSNHSRPNDADERKRENDCEDIRIRKPGCRNK